MDENFKAVDLPELKCQGLGEDDSGSLKKDRDAHD
jgi:hypothetical protein